MTKSKPVAEMTLAEYMTYLERQTPRKSKRGITPADIGMTAEQLGLPPEDKPKRRSKYNAVRVNIMGLWFDSKAEGNRYLYLVAEQDAGRIHTLRTHTAWVLQPEFAGYCNGALESFGPITYESDFDYYRAGSDRLTVEDVKGVRTGVCDLKLKLFLRRYPDVDFQLVYLSAPARKRKAQAPKPPKVPASKPRAPRRKKV